MHADAWDYLNPFHYLASTAGKIVADGWTAAMLGLWNAGLWLLKLVLGLVDAFTTPDISEGGPGAAIYQTTFWIAGALVLTLAMVQFGIAAFRRDGRSLARVLIGTGQFVMVWAAWFVYAVAVLAACGGLTDALMQSLLHVDAWSAWQPWAGFSTEDITDGTVATVLGFMGIFLVFAAIGHLLVMLARAGALIVLAATTPIAAAGLVSDVGRTWFWKSLRWFHAAALTPVLMVLVLGIGVQMTSGVVTGQADAMQTAIGTAVPGVVLICIGCFSPLALFKLLAFVDPGTSSGSALRAGLDAQGGVTGLLGGRGGSGSTSGAASSTDEYGRSQAESAGQDSTSARFTQGAGGLMGKIGGLAGQVGAAGLGAIETLGSRGAAVGADLTNQMGSGHSNYVPDFSKQSPRSGGRSGGGQGFGRDDDNPAINGADGGGGIPGPVVNPTTSGGGLSGTSAGASGAAASSGPGAGAAAGAAASVPIVPV